MDFSPLPFMTHAVLYQLIRVGLGHIIFRFGGHHGTTRECIGMSGARWPVQNDLAVETTGAPFLVDLTTRLIQILIFCGLTLPLTAAIRILTRTLRLAHGNRSGGPSAWVYYSPFLKPHLAPGTSVYLPRITLKISIACITDPISCRPNNAHLPYGSQSFPLK